ncbi:MAG TPA: gephyrin-like molybdotransferase Glp, partial [Chthonomonadaceae bacterium]|nr:gephyrin-like molybdotransferase Glp [Chthonomonadaceae bacterium]
IMLPVEEALTTILRRVKRLPVERMPLLDSLGRVLAEDVAADIAVPPFDNSAVDGYAVRAADTASARTEARVHLRVLSEVVAGTPAAVPVAPGTAARIMTGAPVPPGADAIVMVEDTRNLGAEVEILQAAQRGQHVRHAGEDVARGSIVLRAGARIRAAEIAMLATLGRASVPVFRPARVAVLSTGDEVVEIEEGVAPPPGKIRNSNAYALAALVREAGAEVHARLHVPDDLAATEAALRQCVESGADAIVSAGGVSVGDRDFIKPALERLGRLDLWRVAMKPGKPLAFGSIGETLFFGLPGNPVSALVTFELFARPAIFKMAGRREEDLQRPAVQAIVAEPVAHVPGRREFVRAITTAEGGRFVTRPTGAQGSGILHSLLLANSLLVIPEDSTGLAPGQAATVLLTG